MQCTLHLPRLLRPATAPFFTSSSVLVRVRSNKNKTQSTNHRPFLSKMSSTWTLDRTLFTESLYSSLLTFWFTGLPENATTASPEQTQRWFGVGLSAAEKSSWDGACASQFGSALAALSPERLSLPTFRSYEDDFSHADTLAGPLLAEIRAANARSPKSGAETLLALTLLLDQMPRNIFRKVEDLPQVYRHYDRLAWTLLRAVQTAEQQINPNPLEHPWLRAPVRFMWMLLPLEHSEDRASHAVAKGMMEGVERELRERGDEEGEKFWSVTKEQAEKHREIVERFGRYPHRNESLRRESTAEEKEWLREGETFGVVQGK